MGRRGKLCFAVIGLLAASTGCGSSGGANKAGSQPQTSDTTAQGRVVRVVAIGDSDATGIGDASSRGWVGRYGDLLKAKLGTVVTVENRAMEGETSDQLRSDIANDPALRQALAGADVVLIGIGGADLNAGDDALSTGACRGRDCYAKILRRFDANISAIASQVRQVTPHALVRAMSLPNAFPGGGSVIPPFITAGPSRHQVFAERAAVCQAMRSNGGRCVDVVTAFNGPRGDGDAYAKGLMTKDPCCYPSAKGQQLIAQLLIAEGLNGLRQAS
jgi:lysophospholipase L1-like esterase